MTDLMQGILVVAGALQVVLLIVAVVVISVDADVSGWHSETTIGEATFLAEAEAALIGIVALALAIAYGVSLHQAAWN